MTGKITQGAIAATITQVRRILERHLAENPGTAHTSYDSVLGELPTLRENIEGQRILWNILGCISIDMHHEGLGMLSVIVWNENDEPGSGFYYVAKKYCGWPQSASDLGIFVGELRRVYEGFHAP
jgi:hypothetical protein